MLFGWSRPEESHWRSMSGWAVLPDWQTGFSCVVRWWLRSNNRAHRFNCCANWKSWNWAEAKLITLFLWCSRDTRLAWKIQCAEKANGPWCWWQSESERIRWPNSDQKVAEKGGGWGPMHCRLHAQGENKHIAATQTHTHEQRRCSSFSKVAAYKFIHE